MALLRAFRKIVTSNRDLNLVQDALKDTLDSILACPLLGGQLLANVSLLAGANTVGHGLGRSYVSWGWMRPSAGVTLYETRSVDPTQFLMIVASAPLTVDLFVF